MCEESLSFVGSDYPFLVETVLVPVCGDTVSELSVEQNLSRTKFGIRKRSITILKQSTQNLVVVEGPIWRYVIV